jgi:hypothetical protein
MTAVVHAPRQAGFLLARIFYALVGVVALVAVGVAVVGAVAAGAGGCELVFSQADFTVGMGDGPACQQYVDLVAPGVALALGVILVATALRLGLRPDRWGPIVVVGVAAGIIAGLVPLYLVVWLVSYYRQTPGAVEVLIGGLPLLAALASAWAVWRAYRRAPPPIASSV